MARKNPLAEIRRSLKTAAKALERAARMLGDSALRPQGAVEKKRKLSPKARKSLQLQGRYLGYVRQLKPRQRAMIRALRDKKGVHAAISTARQLAHKKRGTA